MRRLAGLVVAGLLAAACSADDGATSTAGPGGSVATTAPATTSARRQRWWDGVARRRLGRPGVRPAGTAQAGASGGTSDGSPRHPCPASAVLRPPCHRVASATWPRLCCAAATATASCSRCGPRRAPRPAGARSTTSSRTLRSASGKTGGRRRPRPDRRRGPVLDAAAHRWPPTADREAEHRQGGAADGAAAALPARAPFRATAASSGSRCAATWRPSSPIGSTQRPVCCVLASGGGGRGDHARARPPPRPRRPRPRHGPPGTRSIRATPATAPRSCTGRSSPTSSRRCSTAGRPPSSTIDDRAELAQHPVRVALQPVDELEGLALRRRPPAAPCSARRARDALVEGLALALAPRSAPASSSMSIVDRSWLVWACSAASLASAKPATSSTWSGSSASNRSSALGPVVGERLLGEEVRVARGHDPLDGEQPGVAVVGVEAVALPRVVAEHHGGPQRADPVGDLPALPQPGLELAVGPAEEHALAGGAEGRRRPLAARPGG